ncbi:MAG: hypothetical protein ACRDD7_08475 [Peptostreptococcaceae bacterium]
MRTWEIVLKEMEIVEAKMLKNGFSEELENRYSNLKSELEEVKPIVRYQTYRFDNGAYQENTVVNTKLITDPTEAAELLDWQGAKAMTCEIEGQTQHIQYYNIDGDWYPLILGMGRTLQKIGTQWAKNMKKSIKMYSFGRYENHEAIYNDDFETVSFS